MSSEEGGTNLARLRQMKEQKQQQSFQQQVQQAPQQQVQYSNFNQPEYQQLPPQQPIQRPVQQHFQQPVQQPVQAPVQAPVQQPVQIMNNKPQIIENTEPKKSKEPFNIKSFFGSGVSNTNRLSLAIFVVLLFILLNSKLIWTQLQKLPFMGSIEPSIFALIINSLLAGIVFYVASSFIS